MVELRQHRIMTSCHGNAFRILALWAGNPPGDGIEIHRWRNRNPPVTESTDGFLSGKACNAELWYFLCCQPEQTFEQTVQLPVIWDPCDVTLMNACLFWLGYLMYLMAKLHWAWIILGIVMPPLIGWAYIQNDPCRGITKTGPKSNWLQTTNEAMC